MKKSLLVLLVAVSCLIMNDVFAINEASHLSFGQDAIDVVVDGDYAYVLTAQKDLKVVDVSVATAPVLIHSMSIASGYVQCLEKEGNFLYLGAFETVLIIDVQIPSSPTIVGSYQYNEWIKDIEVVGSTAYIEAKPHFVVLDVSNPSAPAFLGELRYPFWNRDDLEVAAYGNYVFVANYDSIKVIDVSVASSPNVVQTFAGYSGEVYEIAISGNYLYAGAKNARGPGNHDILVVDISNPLSPSAVISYPISSAPLEVRPEGNYLYIGEDNGKMEVLDITDPHSPFLIAVFQWSDKLYEMKFQNELAYVAANSTGLLILEDTVNQLPVADAGEDQVADANEIVTLNGTNSYDPDGHIATYTWKRIPENSVLYSGPQSAYDTRALGKVEEVIELTVVDDSSAIATDTVSIHNRRFMESVDKIDDIDRRVNPTIEIISLNDGDEVSGVVYVSITSNNEENMSHCYLYIDGRRIGYDYSSPFSFNWNSQYFRNGPHTVKVRGYFKSSTYSLDFFGWHKQGKQSVIDKVEVNVNN